MTTQAKKMVRASAAGRPLVERPAPGKAPTAFRIWAFGPNICDGKTVVFSERSAEMLLAEQAARARLYSFDFDHRSMMQDVSPEAGKSAGWHVLELRPDEAGKPELWATQCEWTEVARAGLEAVTPEWRYFSPTYDLDPLTGEVVGYVGCALTNNPLTHGIPALASASGRPSSSARPRALAGGPAPTMASARVQIAALNARMVKLEAASAIRARAPSPPPTPSAFDEALAQAERNTLRSLGPSMASARAKVRALTERAHASALPRAASGALPDPFFDEALAQAERNALHNIGRKAAEGIEGDVLALCFGRRRPAPDDEGSDEPDAS
ncbi:MAG: hypothetical protein KF894_26945 [Labilithrix sp.]|nr:hypothetical protein [Labilithrix sp.]